MTHAERATRYATDVVDGTVPACSFVRLACQRHIDDLAKSEDPDYAFEYDHGKANHVCEFIELLPHVKGKWQGTLIVLEDWQCFLICIPFGWLRRDDGFRRFRKAYWEVPRKNAKSTLSAAVGLYMLCGDGELGAEVYSGATSEKQAWEVFGPARLMAKQTPDLLEHYGVDVNAKNLTRLGSNAKMEPVIGNPGDGASPHFAIIDEYHEHKDDRQYDTMDTGMGAREQPMMWTITTAGTDTSGPCYALRGDLENVLTGLTDDDEFCGAIWTIDAGDDWTSEAVLRKANPNFGVSVFPGYLLSQQKKGLDSPRKQSTVKTKHFNVWSGAADPYFNAEKWRRMGDPTLNIADFEGLECWMGVDVAAKIDLACKGMLFRRDESGEEHWYWVPTFYVPEEQVKQIKIYQGWESNGHIVATDGNIIDLDEIEADIKADAERFRIVRLGYDPWNAQQLTTHLSAEGIECVEVFQTTPNLSNPMKWIQALIEDGRIHHDGNPVMSWCMENVTAKEDRNDNVYPRKEHRDKKIDGAVTLIIAKGQAFEPEPEQSYLETGDMVFLD